MSNNTTDPNRMDNRPEQTRAVSGEITFGDFVMQYDAFAWIINDELLLDSIAIMSWKMNGEDWSSDQLRKVYESIDAALHECESSITHEIAEAHLAKRWAKNFASIDAR